MTPAEQESLLTLSLMAAFADGGKSDVERTELKRIAESLGDADARIAALHQRVLLKQVSLQEAVAPLASPEVRQLAYEMAVCTCESDDVLNNQEQTFLGELRRELQLDAAKVSGFEKEVQAVATEPVATVSQPPPLAAAAAHAGSAPATPEAELDKSILNYSILNGALELMPGSLATMAIIPLQMKMVYSIGKRYGHELDRGHITELLAAAGVGLTSQVVEGYARRLVGGLLGKVGGGLLRGLGNQAAGSAMSFATTYALGQLAKRYYGGGRTLSGLELRELFNSLVDQARGLQSRYAPDIQQKVREVDVTRLLPLIRGGR